MTSLSFSASDLIIQSNDIFSILLYSRRYSQTGNLSSKLNVFTLTYGNNTPIRAYPKAFGIRRLKKRLSWAYQERACSYLRREGRSIRWLLFCFCYILIFNYNLILNGTHILADSRLFFDAALIK